MFEDMDYYLSALVDASSITVLAFIAIVLLEAVILRIMGWRSIWVALVDSFLMNLAITFFGVFLGLLNIISLSPRVWVMMWGASVAVEGILLHMFRQESAQKTWIASLGTNIVSYLMLAGIHSVLL